MLGASVLSATLTADLRPHTVPSNPDPNSYFCTTNVQPATNHGNRRVSDVIGCVSDADSDRYADALINYTAGLLTLLP